MFSFQLDIEQLYQAFDLDKQKVEQFIDITIKGITARYAQYWENEAKLSLHQTRRRYIESLKVIDEGKMRAAVLLDYSQDKLVSMLEEGASAFDMKEGFLKSAKVHRKKDGGVYLTIPFRVGSPGIEGESDLFSGSFMPSEIYDVVREKETKVTATGSASSAGLKLGEIPAQYRMAAVRPAVQTLDTKKTFDEYTNKSSIFTGLTKRKDLTTGQNTYMSFRRVSDKSDPMSWIHTGILAHQLAEKAMNKLDANVEGEMSNIFDNAFLQATGS